MPQIIQNAVKAINSTFVSIRCWSTLPDWDKERWMEVQVSPHYELLLDLIEAIEDPGMKAQKLTLFHQALVKETSKPSIKIQQPKVDLEQIYSRFTQSNLLGMRSCQNGPGSVRRKRISPR